MAPRHASLKAAGLKKLCFFLSGDLRNPGKETMKVGVWFIVEVSSLLIRLT